MNLPICHTRIIAKSSTAAQSHSTSADLPSVDDIKNLNKDQLATFLRSKKDKMELRITDSDIDIIYNQDVAGIDIFDLKEESLERWGIKGGPAMRIVRFGKKLKGEGNFHNFM